MTAPTWLDHAIFWHVYPLGAVGAPIRDRGSHANPAPPSDLLRWLDHAVELGANGLQLGPIFTSATHGYDTLDYFSIDPRFGGEEVFAHLVGECRRRGLRLVLDGVFNHVGSGHPLFQRALAEGPEGECARLFSIDFENGTWADFEGHHDLVALNHDSPEVVDLVVDAMTYWLERGIDGWRLDAAYAVPPEFWSRVLPRVRERFPDAWFVGEVIHGDYLGIVETSALDGVTQYELWKATWSSLLDRNMYELAHALGRHNDFVGEMLPMTFVSNHDVTRIATRLGERGAVLAAAILLTVAGVPSIYYGDELGMTGEKTEGWGGDDAVRPALPPDPDGSGSQWVWNCYRALVSVRRRFPWLVRAVSDVRELSNERIVIAQTGSEDDGELLVEIDAVGEHVTIRHGADVLFGV